MIYGEMQYQLWIYIEYKLKKTALWMCRIKENDFNNSLILNIAEMST